MDPQRAQVAAARLDDLDTPAVVIDLDRVEANIAKAQAYAEGHRLALRPHVKTHKLPTLAHRQVRSGAVGITSQRISEAADAQALARLVVASEGLAFRGRGTHPLGAGADAFVREARALLAADGIEAPVFSGGGTPTMWRAHEHAELTELRVGTYVYHDRATVGAGAATLDDCALHVLATVVSVPERSRAVIDAGSKTLTSDRIAEAYGAGYGHVIEAPGAVIASLSEEHGVLDLSACPVRLRVGDRVRSVPNHACPVSNLDDHVVAHRGDRVAWVAPVWARGATR